MAKRDGQEADRQVSRHMRERRIMLGLTQQKLGALIGVTYQQVNKYESGTNRLSAGRLKELARVMGVPIGYFFDEVPSDEATEAGVMPGRAALQLMRAFYQCSERERTALSALVLAMSQQHET
jgi:transcriptional regulator with XRE-family HTH domain